MRNLAEDPAYTSVRRDLRDLLLDPVILQDYSRTPSSLFRVSAP